MQSGGMMARLLVWLVAAVTGLVAAVFIAFMVSPEPGVWVISRIFARGDARTIERTAPFVPPGVIARQDIAYGTGADERLDLFLPPVGVPRRSPVIVWVHGGGFVTGSKESVANWLKLVAAAGYPVVSVEYTRGASRAYPLPVRQLQAALAFLQANQARLGVDGSRIVLGGDSAGAHIAAQAALSVTNPAYARGLGVKPAITADQLKGMLLASGLYDVPDLAAAGWIRPLVRAMFWGYTGYRNLSDAPGHRYFSIPDNVGASFPPSFITGGNGDALTVQGKKLANALRRSGVVVDTLFFDDNHMPLQPHEFQFALDTPEGKLAFQRMMAFIGSLSSPDQGSASRQTGDASVS